MTDLTAFRAANARRWARCEVHHAMLAFTIVVGLAAAGAADIADWP